MRCLLIAPLEANTDELIDVLAAHNAETERSFDVGAGVGLARADLAQFDFALALLPDHPGAPSAATAAIYVEIGVVVGRGLPVLVFTAPDSPAPAALAGLTSVTASLDNVDALRLHIGLFLRTLASEPRTAAHRAQPVGDTLAAATRARLKHLRRPDPDPRKPFDFEDIALDLLRGSGALVEQRSFAGGDTGVDAAAFVEGTEEQLGTLVVQCKWSNRQPPLDSWIRSRDRLSDYVLQSPRAFGLFIYGIADASEVRIPPTNLVFTVSIDQLVADLADRSLPDLLIQARNRLVHQG